MPHKVQPPPRLLLGATLLFWGAMSGNAMMGLIIALLIEGANWIRFRWNFDHTAYSRAWRISMTLLLITGVLIWLDGERYTALPQLILWLPILLLPLQLVQSYGLRVLMPLNSLSFFSELRRQRNRRLGLSDSVVHFNFGNPYFIVCILAASLGHNADNWIFLPGLVILSGCLVFSRTKARPLALAVVMLLAGIIGFCGQIGMSRLYDWVTNRSHGAISSRTNLTVKKTNIGSLGKIKQSPEMFWRLKITEGDPAPRLLRLATYNYYKHISWRIELPEVITAFIENKDDTFTDLTTREIVKGAPHFLLREDTKTNDIAKPRPTFTLRGAIRSGDPLPLPGDTTTLQSFEFDGVEGNPLGTVRVFPSRSIINGTVRWRENIVPEAPPWPEQDLAINTQERETVEQITADLGLRELPTTAAKVARIQAWFMDEFTYTRYLTIDRTRFGKPSAISVFLSKSKRGHCEYFATAAALLLRAADVPARYCVGFAVTERNMKRDEFVIRGTHGHAWTRVWDESKEVWFDFDPTPPNWLAVETAGASESRWLADAYQRSKEDFFLWRNRPANRLGATLAMWALGLITLALIGRRLWKSKLVFPKDTAGKPIPPKRITPLHHLDSSARNILGPRPTSVSLATWLRGLSGYYIPVADLEEALEIHQRIRFDPLPPQASAEIRLQALAQEISARIKRAKPMERLP